ncbi:MAG: amino acid ABC transporter permease [Chloroflexaceae bacterium]|jgi:polar amino acid transport system permease protein|nr:amino acid ABC transporter permease [Chloroflexaceae bacterium]
MASRASKLPTPSAPRRLRVPFRTALLIWWCIWLALLLFFFSGVQFSIGPIQIRTIVLNTNFIAEFWPFISRGVLMTLQLALVSIVCASTLALLAALARLSRVAPLNSLAGLYISLMRGTPLFLQFLFIYAALPRVGLIFDAFTSAAIALSLNYGAYMSEIFRAGIQAVGRGQTEAAYALGMTPWQTMRRIVLPQAFRIITPDIGNQFIAMQKDTSLASAIGLGELMQLARQAGNPRQAFFEALIVAALWYWLLTIVFSFGQSLLEKRMARSDRHQEQG